jgi:uncharacterized membrane protein HdeD (DUF308 family)
MKKNSAVETETVIMDADNNCEAKDICDFCPDFIKTSRAALIWRGVIFIVFALLIFLRPASAITVVVTVFGVYVAIEGAVLFAGALSMLKPTRTTALINAVILLLLAAAAIAFPWMMGEYAIVFFGAWQFISGVQCLVMMRNSRSKSQTLFSGILSIIAGIFFMTAPFIGLLAMSWVFALLFAISGIMMLITGIALHK